MMQRLKRDGDPLWTSDGEPTTSHLDLMLGLAYTPSRRRTRAYLARLHELYSTQPSTAP